MALARGARAGGARIFEQTRVTGVTTRGGRVTGVTTDAGDIEAEVVVNCTGMWGREFGQGQASLSRCRRWPTTTWSPRRSPACGVNLPTIKTSDDFAYVKDEAGALMVGFFEPGSYAWSSRGIPADAEFATLPEDWDHLGPFYERMIERVPVLAETGIRLFFSGPESFTPDGLFHLGEVPDLDNYFVACGFNSIGFLSGPGAGEALAEWIVDGHPPVDLPEADPRRVIPFQTNRRFLEQRVVETLDLAYTIHWPFEQRDSARGIRRSPLHDRVAAAGAVFGELAGWERANWYAVDGIAPEGQSAYGRPNFFDAWAAEHRAVREGVGRVRHQLVRQAARPGPGRVGPAAAGQRRRRGRRAGQVVYTQWLNERGGIEADVTVTRVAETEFLVLTAAATVGRDASRLQRHIGDAFVTVTDVSAGYAMMSVMGPRSRDLLAPLTDADLSNDAFPFRTSRHIDLGLGYVRATRITYVGELGWELLVPSDAAVHVYDTVTQAGQALGLRHAGYHALNSLRMEKAYRSWGHDIRWADTPVEAGLGFAVAWDKPGGFIGQEAVVKRRAEGPVRRLVQISFDDPDVWAYHDEPIYRDDVLAGRIASVSYGHTLGRTVGLGYVGTDVPVDADWVTSGTYTVEVAGVRYPATVSLRPMYDPANECVRR